MALMTCAPPKASAAQASTTTTTITSTSILFAPSEVST
jgi:hypothetical protein